MSQTEMTTRKKRKRETTQINYTNDTPLKIQGTKIISRESKERLDEETSKRDGKNGKNYMG